MLWATVDLICVTIFLSFILSPCFILINVNLLLVVSVTVRFCLPFFVLYSLCYIGCRFALVDMVSHTIIRLAFLRYAQLLVFEGKIFLLVKLIDIQKNYASFKSLNLCPVPTNMNPCTQKLYSLITKFDNFYVSLFANIRGKVLNQRLWKVEN